MKKFYLYNICADYYKFFVDELIKKDYRYINQYNFTQDDYINFMKEFFYIIHIKMSDSSKYDENAQKEVNKCYNELIWQIRDFKVKRYIK